jgi:hypothetical protein
LLFALEVSYYEIYVIYMKIYNVQMMDQRPECKVWNLETTTGTYRENTRRYSLRQLFSKYDPNCPWNKSTNR